MWAMTSAMYESACAEGVGKTADEGPLLTGIVGHVQSVVPWVGMLAEAPPAANDLPNIPMVIVGRMTRIAAGKVTYSLHESSRPSHSLITVYHRRCRRRFNALQVNELLLPYVNVAL